MSYVEAIRTAIIIFPFIAFLFTIPFILHNYHKYGSIHFLRVFIIYTFILYLITIYFLVILPLPTFTEAMQNKGPFIKKIYKDLEYKILNNLLKNDFNEIKNYLEHQI